jgi:hypothetical protein
MVRPMDIASSTTLCHAGTQAQSWASPPGQLRKGVDGTTHPRCQIAASTEVAGSGRDAPLIAASVTGTSATRAA